MKKMAAHILSACLILCLAACSAQEQESIKEPELSQPSIEDTSQSENTVEEETKIVSEAGQEHILIAYFTWADNTVVEDEEAAIQSALAHYASVGDSANYIGLDATTTASIVKPGNTAKMAEWIQQYVGGDLFSIVVTEPYPDNYDECLDRAAEEKADNARPELSSHVDNMEDYDVIFLGFPNWWYTAPMTVFSFIEEYDFSGKTIVPFCAHGTGGIAASVRDITAALPDSVEVLESLGVYRADINQAQSSIHAWLAELGFQEKGDLCLYAPWGNLSVFYQDFRYSNSLILLGHIDSGIDVISSMNGDFSATLEAAD